MCVCCVVCGLDCVCLFLLFGLCVFCLCLLDCVWFVFVFRIVCDLCSMVGLGVFCFVMLDCVCLWCVVGLCVLLLCV